MRFYEDLTKLHINTLPPRAHYIPSDTPEKALAGDAAQSDYYTLLNGTWDFCYFPRDIDCPATITQWMPVRVPSCWASIGCEKPYYTNVTYPYPVDPPFVPDDNPLGVYRKLITIDSLAANRENYLIFDGVASCLELYINGEFIGFSSVSHGMSEFKVRKSASLAQAS